MKLTFVMVKPEVKRRRGGVVTEPNWCVLDPKTDPQKGIRAPDLGRI